ncbi:MAG: glutamine amidotransferase, partial [Elusimicrobia bacterium]|nr:glutamine amidotransferase [Elusimicrobiota bacterium]
RQKYRIMYLAGRPSFEYAHLREQLRSDPNHELVSFVILRNPENVLMVPDYELSLIPFPAQEIFVQNLMQFDLFILENFAYWRFNLPVQYLDGLKRFVAQGGGLLVVGGSNAFSRGGYQGTPLEEILPVTLWQDKDDYSPGLFSPRLAAPDNPLVQLADTPQAVASLWRSLPPLDGFNRFQSVRSGSAVLLAHPSEKLPSGQALPIVAVREYGKGKVMVVGTDSTWRWRLGAGSDWRLSAFYSRFWSRAVQYLSGSLELKKVRFAPLPDRMPPREPATLTVNLFDESFRPLSGSEADLRVLWTAPNGRTRPASPRELRPGVFEIELTGLGEGVHQLRAVARYRGQAWGEDTARFEWRPRPPESPLNRRRLQETAERSGGPGPGPGGRYADLDRVPAREWLEALPPVRRESEVLRRYQPFDSQAWLWLIAAVLILEWLLRRRLGFA